MESAFGIDHGDVSKAMSPNKANAFRRITGKGDFSTTKSVSEHFYASDKLTAHAKGKRARTAPKAANPGGWMSANNKLAHQGKEAAASAKTTENIRSRRKLTRRLP